MKIVSVTHTNRSDDMIVDALKSVVDLVDACIVINTTGEEKDYSIEESVVGDKLIKENFRKITHNESSIVKNFDLIMANKHGADWALLLDTDERIICKQDIRKQLEESKADLFLAYSHDGQYTKERLIRIPAQGMFEGVAHETFLNTNRALIEGLTFTELPKSPELIKEKCLVVAECLSEDLKKNPVNFRNRSYLGATLIGLGKFEEAIEQFKQILDVPFDPEMSAGSHVYMASCYFELQKFQEALDTCLAGIKFQPIAELFFIAGYSYLMLGDLKKALCFAELAVAAGELRGYNPVLKRLGMRNTHMLYEWPFEIMIKVYEASGHKENAELFKSIRDDAKNKRLKKYSEEEINDANKNNARNSW